MFLEQNVRDNRVAGVDCPFQSRPVPQYPYAPLDSKRHIDIIHRLAVAKGVSSTFPDYQEFLW